MECYIFVQTYLYYIPGGNHWKNQFVTARSSAKLVPFSHYAQRTMYALLLYTAPSPGVENTSYLHASYHINIWNLRGERIWETFIFLSSIYMLNYGMLKCFWGCGILPAMSHTRVEFLFMPGFPACLPYSWEIPQPHSQGIKAKGALESLHEKYYFSYADITLLTEKLRPISLYWSDSMISRIFSNVNDSTILYP